MIRDPALLDWLRGGAERRDREALIDELWDEAVAARDEEAERLALRRFRQREILRIGYNDIVRGLPLEVITLDLSHLADACVEVACRLARRRAEARHGVPSGRRRQARAVRRAGAGEARRRGAELQLRHRPDLPLRRRGPDLRPEASSPTPSSSPGWAARSSGSSPTTPRSGMAYRVDMRLRPEGDQGALARSLAATLGYYETSGRTWERQALIKCRPIAGDLDLGRTFLDAITPFVYRRYLSGAEIGEIKAMKRRIEQRTVSAGTAEVEVKTGRGGIRDVEFVVQFLQLLHGGQYPEVRHANTLLAIARLEQVGCLTAEERSIMEDTYRFLRQVEHRLQTMFDRQTHEMPRDLEELRTLAIRMGYPPASVWEDRTGPAQRFLNDYRAKTELNRRILNHLLHDAFRDDAGAAADPVVDLVLDPDPTPEQVAEVARAATRSGTAQTAYQNLMALAREDFPFLSQARCRHFLAAIAPRLLQAVSRTPDPDMALTNLEKVSASLGAKAILWELFNFNPPTLRLYVELCATSQFLSEILINNPGMIDDLMDSLVVDRPQPASAIKAELAELCKGAEDLAPILLSFRNKEWVRIGTRDILGREPVRDVTRELADVAEAIVAQVARDQWHRRAARYGTPRRASDGQRDRWAIVGLGKLGGRELNYHSDLDLIFLHEADGETAGRPGVDLRTTSSSPRSSAACSRRWAARPRPARSTRSTPGSGRTAPRGRWSVTLDAFRDYFRGPAQPWERLALTRARVIFATGGFGRTVTEAIRDILAAPVDRRGAGPRGPRDAPQARGRVRTTCKRGLGGLADIEFLVQYLQLVHAATLPDLARPNLWDALDALRRAGLLSPEAHADLRDAYDFLRTVEGRLRLVHNRSERGPPRRPRRSSPGSPAASTTPRPTRPPPPCPSAPTPTATPSARRQIFHELVGQAAGEPMA